MSDRIEKPRGQGLGLERAGKNLTATIKYWEDYGLRIVPLPHPSPHNNIWLRRKRWFADSQVSYYAK